MSLYVKKRTAVIAFLVGLALGIAAGYYVLAEHVHKSACESAGMLYQHPNPDREGPKSCWPVVQR